ncbi:MAG: hypothetical protein A2027_04300 [Thermodesulfovibrio sp. RBG_19FT_COMBO_41_18]|nr:MAG: hypothetical protein A2027_04300 [Thermodesulfovibrio sp. RBG_19FT_COMBO_41_18]
MLLNIIRTNMNDLDKFTSTGAKYIHHPQMIESLRNGIGRPQSLQVALSNKCNLKCVFCSVAERELKQEWDYLELCKAIDSFMSVGIKTIEFSGGGEPTLYPDFRHIVSSCYSRGLKIGLITNGLKLKDYQEILPFFDWIRISMVALDYQETIDLPDKFPDNVTIGMSYVVGQKEYQGKRTYWESDTEQLLKISEYAVKHNVRYVRIVPDCHSDFTEMLQLHEKYGLLCESLGHPFMFQYKLGKQAIECYMDSVKPWLDTDGFVYSCNSIPLNSNSGYKFNEKYRLCHWTEIENYYKNRGNQSLKIDSCDYCVFTKNNEIIRNLLTPIQHGDFV